RRADGRIARGGLEDDGTGVLRHLAAELVAPALRHHRRGGVHDRLSLQSPCLGHHRGRHPGRRWRGACYRLAPQRVPPTWLAPGSSPATNLPIPYCHNHSFGGSRMTLGLRSRPAALAGLLALASACSAGAQAPADTLTING